MGYFQVRYDSRVIICDRTDFIRLATEDLVNYDCKLFIRLGTVY